MDDLLNTDRREEIKAQKRSKYDRQRKTRVHSFVKEETMKPSSSIPCWSGALVNASTLDMLACVACKCLQNYIKFSGEMYQSNYKTM